MKRPRAFASVTVPLADAPARITVLPPAETGEATVAVKVSPGWLIFEPSACWIVTAICVPAGTTTTTGCGGGGGADATAGAGAGAGAAAGAGAGAVPGAAAGALDDSAGALDGAAAGAAAVP